ncbi:DNA uptake lipoprotein [Paenibacillus sp. 481]|uniref:DNA uptake lipoprotein n=1 Tax=Paenibacillus sp. 481 TaxID=2835869 RepID=UPI001E5AB8FC|nr:DNA uptake lipoprotein [Paenibacillus sp. 481]UHA72654.1 DNA uptake lipoprotein [Paenibacillus sp. 481]
MQRPATYPHINAVIVFTFMTFLLLGCTSIIESKTSTDTELPLTGSSEHKQPAKDKAANKDNEQTVIASPNQTQQPQQAGADKQGQPWNRNDPKLKGIALYESSEDVIKRWGEPTDKYTMDDTDPIEVMEYDGFAFGCSTNGEVAFIEVSGNGISTGISELKVGDNDSAAVRVLGKPDLDTDYVWSYKTDKSLLRLDLDPKTNRIQSVKLFPHEEAVS